MLVFQPQTIFIPEGRKFFANHVAGCPNGEWPNSEEPAYHDFYECELFVRGEGSLFINSKEYIIQSGFFYILEPSSQHLYRAKTETELELYNLKFSVDLISPDVRELLRRQKKPFACHLEGEIFERIKLKIEEIIRVAEGYYIPSEDYKLTNRFVQGMVDEVVLNFLSHTTSNVVDPEETNIVSSAKIQSLIQWINEHYADSISAQDAAEEIDLSVKYFSSYFKRHVGMSFNEYIYRTRVSRAMDMLDYTNMSMKEICYETGFVSSAHFTKTFIKYAGITPTAYRNRGKE